MQKNPARSQKTFDEAWPHAHFLRRVLPAPESLTSRVPFARRVSRLASPLRGGVRKILTRVVRHDFSWRVRVLAQSASAAGPAAHAEPSGPRQFGGRRRRHRCPPAMTARLEPRLRAWGKTRNAGRARLLEHVQTAPTANSPTRAFAARACARFRVSSGHF